MKRICRRLGCSVEQHQLRANCKQAIVDMFVESGDGSLLEAEFVVKSNDLFHLISDKVKEKTGKMDSDKIYFEFRGIAAERS